MASWAPGKRLTRNSASVKTGSQTSSGVSNSPNRSRAQACRASRRSMNATSGPASTIARRGTTELFEVRWIRRQVRDAGVDRSAQIGHHLADRDERLVGVRLARLVDPGVEQFDRDVANRAALPRALRLDLSVEFVG